MVKQRKIPIRKCLATHTAQPKKDMFRIVRKPDGTVEVDTTGKQNGRGAYLSKTKKAIQIAKEKKLLEKELEVIVPNEIFEQLLQFVNDEN